MTETENARRLMSEGDVKGALKQAEKARQHAAKDKDLDELAVVLEVATALREMATDARTAKNCQSLIGFTRANIEFFGGTGPPTRDGARDAPAAAQIAVSDVLEVKGHSGTVIFDGRTIRISRKGFLARASVGKGEKQIPLAHLTAVQFKPAGPLINGYIQFTVPGGNESRSQFGSQTVDAVRDENSVVFHYQQRKKFEHLRDVVQAALAEYHDRPVAQAPAPTPASATIPEQIQATGGVARVRRSHTR